LYILYAEFMWTSELDMYNIMHEHDIIIYMCFYVNYNWIVYVVVCEL
jgi:hypothetical protein